MNNVELLNYRQLKVIYEFFCMGGFLKKDRGEIFSYVKELKTSYRPLSDYRSDPVIIFILKYLNI